MNVCICRDCNDNCVIMTNNDWIANTCINGHSTCEWKKIDLTKVFMNLNLGDLNECMDC